MPNKLTQHSIRQRAAQTLFEYEIRKAMSEAVLTEFKNNVEKINRELAKPIRFDIAYQDERITVRDFPRFFTKPLKEIDKIYEILDIPNREKTAVYRALSFIRDFGGYTKRMNDQEAVDLYKDIFMNLNLVRLFNIELEEENIAVRVRDFLRASFKSETPEAKLEVFNKVFSDVHSSVREKITVEIFKPLTVQDEVAEVLAQTEPKFAVASKGILEQAKQFALNYDNDTDEEVVAPAYFTELVDGILEKKNVLDAALSEYLAKGWTFSRLTTIEQALLRLGAYEILFTETPDLVAINEAIELTKDFSDEKSSKFINGMLTNLIKK
jgi:N utilization substance protein B